MHELSLCEGVLQVLEDEARKQDFDRVNAVWLEIGRLAGVEIDALRFSFDIVVRDTLADGAELNIIDVPGTAWCECCADTVSITQLLDACPNCDSYQLRVTGGNEMRIKELEVN